MRVMRVMAGNFPTNVNKVSKKKIYVYVYGWKSPRNHPHHPHSTGGPWSICAMRVQRASKRG